MVNFGCCRIFSLMDGFICGYMRMRLPMMGLVTSPRRINLTSDR